MHTTTTWSGEDRRGVQVDLSKIDREFFLSKHDHHFVKTSEPLIWRCFLQSWSWLFTFDMLNWTLDQPAIMHVPAVIYNQSQQVSARRCHATKMLRRPPNQWFLLSASTPSSRSSSCCPISHDFTNVNGFGPWTNLQHCHKKSIHVNQVNEHSCGKQQFQC